ncbi:MAG: phosphoglucosamine mutase [Clostridia bacterium]|nr:phosphoglucosamine mutase [Clostridia bacterium]
MGTFFGTDGFRGIYGEDISPEITYKLGNSLARLCKQKKKVLIGRDTRRSGSVLALSMTSGLLASGIDVIDIGIAPTPVVAFLAKKLDVDYGIVISASHNPRHHNGIKIFDNEGYKISGQDEGKIERNILKSAQVSSKHLGRYKYCPKLIQLYKKEVISRFSHLHGLKIALDCANGASSRLAKELFQKCGAKVFAFNCQTNGKKINVNCGALYPNVISSLTKKYNCDVGFSFDGDADRIIACDEEGNILDGDDILYILSSKYSPKIVVGTSMTNKGLELALKEQDITMLRADVGDKYVSLLMRKENAFLGGESSGHIINSNYSSTGDGILTALTLACFMKERSEKLSQMCKYKKLPQVIANVEVKDKYSILNSQNINEKLETFQKQIKDKGRILLRASGTESKIRIMCEHFSLDQAKQITQELKELIIKEEGLSSQSGKFQQ